MIDAGDPRASTSPHPDSPHPDIDALADLAEGLPDAEQTARLRAHVTHCADCAAQVEALQEVTRTLGALGPVPMPAAVADRLDVVLRAEQQRRVEQRQAGGAGSAAGSLPLDRRTGVDHRITLGSFGGTPAPEKSSFRRSRLLPALAALALAVGVGFGGYVISASTGLHEPTAARVQVASADLGDEAAALARRGDLDAYTFSQTWRCAGRVVEGRITGLVPAWVDGSRAVLVYTRDNGRTVVTVVTGCPAAGPTAGPSAVLPR